MTSRICTFLLSSILGLSLFLLLGGKALGASGTPDLPPELEQSPSMPTLIEFYSEWCSTCRKMLPILHEIQMKTEGRLRIFRFDIDDQKNQTLVDRYQINGTPTYFLYNRAGLPVYKMSDRISSSLLKIQAYKTAGISHPALDPASLSRDAPQKPYMLLQFHRDNCKPCDEGKVFGDYLQTHFREDLAVIELNAKEPAVRKMMREVAVKKTPGYLLLDGDGYELLQMEKPMSRQDQVFFWQYFQLIQESRP